MYKFICDDPHYTIWEVIHTNTFETVVLTIDPIKAKLLNHDTFNFDKDEIDIIHSPARLNKYTAGILDLSKTYGRDTTNNKMLYLCKPDDKRLPYFLIPYVVQASFDKVKKQLYITFEYKEWNNSHPIATITQNIGNVDIPENYYEYVLYSKSLNVSIQPFTKDVLRCLKEEQQKDIITNICKKYNIQERKDRVFTIDSPESIDLDDGISVSGDIVSVYITHVPIVLDYLNLWGSFTNRISTIYLPDKKRSMLPMALSQLCSLNQNEERICLVMDIDTKTNTNSISIAKVKIHKNYSYDEEKLLKNPDYIKIREIFKSKNSHDLIEELMILFNKECTIRMKKFKNGIYKHITKSDFVPLPEPIYSYINISRNKKSCYTKYLDECDYAQFTSPIRRLVDILNIIQLCFNENIIYFVKGDEFYEDWLERIDYMNISMRHIRKIQLKCKLLDTFIHQEHKFFTGYVFDKLMRSDNKFKYNVFLPELKMNTSITIQEDLIEYSDHQFKVYVFQNEGELKKKIKLQISNV
jgi:exoribonuclease R